MAVLETPYHHGSHCDLLWTPDSSQPGKIDAIMVPTVRPPVYLAMAAKLARHLGCPLVTLHSAGGPVAHPPRNGFVPAFALTPSTFLTCPLSG